jgi:hypothetical protein
MPDRNSIIEKIKALLAKTTATARQKPRCWRLSIRRRPTEQRQSGEFVPKKPIAVFGYEPNQAND